MAWLGYSEEETRKTRLVLLEKAFRAVERKLMMLHGATPDEEESPAAPDPVAIRAVIRATAGSRDP